MTPDEARELREDWEAMDGQMSVGPLPTADLDMGIGPLPTADLQIARKAFDG